MNLQVLLQRKHYVAGLQVNCPSMRKIQEEGKRQSRIIFIFKIKIKLYFYTEVQHQCTKD